MSTDDKPKPAPAKPEKPVKKPEVVPGPAKLPAFDERRLTFAELVPHALALVPDELIAMARDGRPLVRANAALALAVANHPAHDLVMLVRDSDLHVAQSAAAAIGKLGATARPLIPAATAALDGAQPDVVEAVITAWSELVGTADDELIAALDIPHALALKTIVPAMGKIGKRGIAFLVKAAGHERSRIRMNAIAGLGRLGKTDPETAMATLTQIEGNDSVPDVRTAAKQAMLEVVAREKVVVVDRLPKNIPDFEERKLSRSELLEYEAAIDIEEMIYALQDGRTHVKINAARCLAMKADKAGRGARALGLLLRDSVGQVRREVAVALGKVGPEAVDAGTDLVGALGDAEDDVVEAAIDTLAALGPSVQDALVRGLDASHEAHGVRVGDLIGRLPGGAGILADAFKSPAVNVQVHAALGMGLLRDRVGAGLALLHGARTGGDARTRDAVRRAIEMIDPKGDTGPQAVAIEDFEQRFLGAAELEKHKPALERVGVADLIAYVQLDGREVVRANAATALGVIGAAAAPAATSLGVRLRDDSARVRLASAQALDKLGDAAVVETAGDLVGALGDSDDKVAETCAAVLVARKGRMVGALVRGLETDDPRHGQRIVEVLARLPDAPEILLDAFASPAVNVQVNSAIGLGMLGNDRVGKGRKALEGARTGGWERT
ncbi:MAG: HEAT repeat domain-containing protein, partial [Kofleriaceae bacterium]